MMSNLHVRPATAFKSRRRFDELFSEWHPLFALSHPRTIDL
ncbi:MAG: hypothetical protein V7631_4509 [Massilia sp.]|jgi:hypothetical protein